MIPDNKTFFCIDREFKRGSTQIRGNILQPTIMPKGGVWLFSLLSSLLINSVLGKTLMFQNNIPRHFAEA